MTRSALKARPRLKTRLAAAAAMTLALAACDQRSGARVDAPEPAPLAVLDAAATLPYAGPAPVGRYAPEQGYRWAERAYGEQRIFYDTPPDYGFDYGDAEWLVWETADDWAMYAEPWDDGYRYYYYEPGGSYPYFVRDRYYGYGFDSRGVLVVVIDAGGRYLPAEQFRTVAPLAGRYFAQGRELRSASQQGRRIAVDERTWAVRAPLVTRTAEPWLKAARDDRTWRRWREADRGRELERFAAEQRRRADIQRSQVVQDVRQADRTREAELRRDERSAPDERRDAPQAGRRAAVVAEHQAREPQVQGRQAHEAAAAEARARADLGRDRQLHEQAQRAAAERRQDAEQQSRAEAAQQRRAQPEAQAQARQVQVERQHRDAERAQQGQARAAELQARETARAQQAEAHAAQARSADQQARAAVAREHAARPAKAADPDHGKAKAHGRDRKD